MDIKKVLVVGAGQMGKQIALLSAIHGYETVLYDSFPDALSAAEEWKLNYLHERTAKGKMTQAVAAQGTDLLTFNETLETAVSGCDLVIEAIVEKEDAKIDLFQRLDHLAPVHTLLTTNSSFIPSSVLAAHTQRPERVANLHFFNPALVMELVEVVQGEHTERDTVEALMAFAVSLNKTPIHIKMEIDGFVANRILKTITKEALFLVDQGYVTPQEVDIAVEKGLNHPLGPYRLMDMVGIDISYLSREREYEATKDPKDRAPQFLIDKYNKGELGRKTGKGWYDYN